MRNNGNIELVTKFKENYTVQIIYEPYYKLRLDKLRCGYFV